MLKLKLLNEKETLALRQVAHSHKSPMILVKRAGLILSMVENPRLSASQASLQAGYKTIHSGITWVKRFNEFGLEGLYDQQRPGRPLEHSEEERSQAIALVLKKPRSLGYPFELWTIERLQTALREHHDFHVSGSHLWEWIKAEGLNWKRQEIWFHEPGKSDPQFAEKRGP